MMDIGHIPCFIMGCISIEDWCAGVCKTGMPCYQQLLQNLVLCQIICNATDQHHSSQSTPALSGTAMLTHIQCGAAAQAEVHHVAGVTRERGIFFIVSMSLPIPGVGRLRGQRDIRNSFQMDASSLYPVLRPETLVSASCSGPFALLHPADAALRFPTPRSGQVQIPYKAFHKVASHPEIPAACCIAQGIDATTTANWCETSLRVYPCLLAIHQAIGKAIA